MSLVLKNVSKTFDDTNQATLKNVNLEIKQGEFLCVVGRSGCGKSTLLNLIAGLEKPTSGEILLNGKPVTGPGADRTVMFQEHALFPWLNVIQNVKFGMEMTGVPKEEQERRADKYLEMMQLNDYREYAIHQLSGGMRQRVALARAFTMDSEILLMDEPFSALDKQTSNRLRKELQDIWMQTKKTIFFITHSVEEAVFLGDRIAVMSAAKGSIRNIVDVELDRPRHVYDEKFIEYRHRILDEIQGEDENA
ncbi:MAG TPA: ABC transporter ATP-binding protein [Candidatus Anaerobutyricum avicola]|nr:ABC transporter ATP-binding protein [Candidatus Anaerobutyricum avicola]